MDKILGLSFKLKPPKKAKSDTVRVSNKLEEGLCFYDETDNSFKVHITIEENQSNLTLPFTDDSYELKGREIVFDAKPDKRGNRSMYIRKDRELRLYPGLSTQYITVCENCVFNGFIVRVNGKLHFKLNKFVRYGHKEVKPY